MVWRCGSAFVVADSDVSRHVLLLFVAGDSPHSQRAVQNLRALCRDVLGGEYLLEVIDILSDPDAAEANRIMATPTLITRAPLPRRVLIGDMSDTARVLAAFGVDCCGADKKEG